MEGDILQQGIIELLNNTSYSEKVCINGVDLLCLTPEGIELLCIQNNYNLESNKKRSKNILKPYIAGDEKVNYIHLGSSTPALGDVSVEAGYYQQKGTSLDMDEAINNRTSGNRGGKGDLAVVRSQGAIEMAKSQEMQVCTLGRDIQSEQRVWYRTADELLVATLTNPEKVSEIVNYLIENPNAVFNIYDLNPALEVALLRILDLTNEEIKKRNSQGNDSIQLLTELRVNANRPEEAERYNAKASLYPDIDSVLENSELNNSQIIWQERKKIEMGMTVWGELFEKNEDIDPSQYFLPGISVRFNSENENGGLYEGVIKSIKYLKDKWDLRQVCLKFSRSADGAGVYHSLPVNINSIEELLQNAEWKRAIGKAIEEGQDVVIEPHMNYQQINIGGVMQDGNLSIHSIGGVGTETATAQTTDNVTWLGNATFKIEDITVQKIRQQLKGILENNQQIAKKFAKLGIIKYGIDTAFGTYEGFGGKESRFYFQDPNIRENGAGAARKYENPSFPIRTSVFTPVKGENGEPVLSLMYFNQVLQHIYQEIIQELNLGNDEESLEIPCQAVAYARNWAMWVIGGRDFSQVHEINKKMQEKLKQAGLIEGLIEGEINNTLRKALLQRLGVNLV